MLVDRNHQISGTRTIERVIRFQRPAFLLKSSEDFRSVVQGACGFSGGIFCHLIPARNGQLADVWSSYIQRLLPDAVYIPNGLEHLKPQLQKLFTGYIGEVDYTKPVPWRGSPSLHSLLAKRNPDGSPVACGPSYLVDVERSSEAPPVSELQRIARFGTVSEVPIGSPQFLGVEQQLWDLVHTVPPASGQGLVDWLLDIPDPDPLVPSPPYLAQGGAIHSAITLNHTGISPGSQSFPPDHRDSSRSLANRLVVVGDGGSLEDACLFWNLRANRWLDEFPAWVTPEQAEHADVTRAIVAAARRTSVGLGPSTDGVDDLHFLSATMDTQEIARTISCEVQVAGWTPTDWIHFIDRRHRRFFGRSKEAMTFSNGSASFVVNDDALPCPRPTQITVDIEIESFRPPPTGIRLVGTNFPRTGRFGESIITLNYWGTSASAEEASLGYPQTFEIVRSACEGAGLRPLFDRKAAMTYGINRILAGEYSTHMILRHHAVLELLTDIMKSERLSDETKRYLTPKGIPFGEVHKKLGSQDLASALLSWLLRKRLVFRGLELECLDCGTSAWYSLNDVGDQFLCVGCQGQQPFDRMPENASWRYRVNQLLASALDQGVLQQALAAYDMDLSSPFTSRTYMFPNVILVDTQTGRHVAEIDLFGFEDGEWIVAECKAWGDATQSELDELRRFLDRLGGGRLQLVRASTASNECDGLVDRVVIWDYEPIREQTVSNDQLRKWLEA